MADNITEQVQETSEGDGLNTESTKGAETQTANTVAATNADDEQKKIDAAVKARLAEEKRRNDAKTKTAIEDAIAVARGEWEKEHKSGVQAAVEAALRERDLISVKKAIQTEYGLSDEQAARLAGDDEEALRTDAATLFKGLKKAPALNPGASTQTASTDSEDDAIAQTLKRLLKR